MSRYLTGHQVNPANDVLKIAVTDERGHGGANHAYVVGPVEWTRNPSLPALLQDNETAIVFQNGPINEFGVNGLTHEVLLAILIDRLQGFQAGQYASNDNQVALEALCVAQLALQRRTRERMARGVEGTHAK